MGGWSSEREVSLTSGAGVADALESLGHRVTRIDMGRDVAALLAEAAPDVVFNALHGCPGEDGSVQGLLDLMGLKYTHSGMATSVIAIDKQLTKNELVPHGIRMPAGLMVASESLHAADPLPRPYVLKPVNEGSSVGVAIVTDEGNYGSPIGRDVEGPWKHFDRLLAEPFIKGRELTVAVLGDRPLAVTELKVKSGFYDYDSKYTDGMTLHICPAQIPAEIASSALAMALKAHVVLGCKGTSRSIALTDSNPLVSILAKLWVHATGGAPVNWLGAFLGVCWLMQPVAAVYAARGLRTGPLACVAAGVLATAWPALLVRMGHINLCAHFLMLLALGLAFRRIEEGRPALLRWIAPGLLLLAAVLTHPYLFQLCAAVLAAVPLQAALRRQRRWWLDAAGFMAVSVLAVGVLTVLSGPIGGGDRGFTFFSMNVLSPIVPQMSGVFAPTRPVIDATGGQYEGFNWIGAGTLLLLVAAVVGMALQRRLPRPAVGLALVLAGLTLMSLSSQIHVGSVRVIDLGSKPWEDVFGSFRSSGRAFWPVGYAIMLGCVAAVDRLRWWIRGPLLLAAAGLQLVDVQPLSAPARLSWVMGTGIAAPAVPGGTTLFTVAPHPGCALEPASKSRAPIMLLDAVRHGARTGDIGLGRSPRWFSCERILSDALELPLDAGESRAFFPGPAQGLLRPGLLGESAVCKRDGDIVLCGRGVSDFPGASVPTRPARGAGRLGQTIAASRHVSGDGHRLESA